MVARTTRPSSPTLRTSTPQVTRRQKQRSTSRKVVKFGSVEVRSFARTIGDSPICYGPPLSLERKTSSQVHYRTMAEYEKTTRSSHEKKQGTSYYPLTPDQRFLLLKKWGVTDEQIKATMNEIQTVQKDFSTKKPSPCWKLEKKLMKEGLIKEPANKLVANVMKGGTSKAAVKTSTTTTSKTTKTPPTPIKKTKATTSTTTMKSRPKFLSRGAFSKPKQPSVYLSV